MDGLNIVPDLGKRSSAHDIPLSHHNTPPLLVFNHVSIWYSHFTHRLVQSQLGVIGAEYWAMHLRYVAIPSSLDLWILGASQVVNATSSHHTYFHGVRFWGLPWYQSRDDSQ